MPNWKKVITSGSDASLNSLNLSSVVNANTDTDKFLVLDSAGNVDFRTGANVLSDINPGGLVSSSAQINLGSTTGTAANATSASYATYAATAGSATTATTATTANAVAFSNITGKPTLNSGSAQIDHDATTNFVANEHIDHSTVSITAGNGLSGGGTIAATRTLSLDTTSATFTNGVKTKLNTEGVISSSVQVSHDSTTGFVANEHIDHSTVSITAGNGLTGGGTIAANRTINVVSANNGIVVNTDNIQLDTTSTTFTAGVKAKLSSEGVISGSQVQHSIQTYVDFKGQQQGALPWGTTTDLQPVDRWFGVWIAPSSGYIEAVYISPENVNTPFDDMNITMYANSGPVGTLVHNTLGAPGVNVKFDFGVAYSFSENDRISLDLDKLGNTSDFYAIQVVFRLNN